MLRLETLVLLGAALCFLLAAVGVSSRVNLVALGLLLLTLMWLVSGL